MNRADTFFIIGKGDEKQALVDLRTGILDEHVHLDYKVVEITDRRGTELPPITRESSRTGTSVGPRNSKRNSRPNLASERFSSGVTLPSTTALCGSSSACSLAGEFRSTTPSSRESPACSRWLHNTGSS